MPIFRFRCQKCQNVFEDLLAHPGDRTSCGKCGSSELEKLPSSFSASVRSSSAPSCCGHAAECPSSHVCGGNCGCHHH
ncbi:MAG: zinc ribbon domain-containing protein [Victivallaceae bacterium]|nr:zinc ribbon domain-containing protein [Victivallaceae bacterium]